MKDVYKGIKNNFIWIFCIPKHKSGNISKIIFQRLIGKEYASVFGIEKVIVSVVNYSVVFPVILILFLNIRRKNDGFDFIAFCFIPKNFLCCNNVSFNLSFVIYIAEKYSIRINYVVFLDYLF